MKIMLYLKASDQLESSLHLHLILFAAAVMNKFTEDQRLEIVKIFYSTGQSPSLTARRFNYWNRSVNNRTAPLCTEKNVRQLMKKFVEHKTVQDRHKSNSGCSKNARTEENILAVANITDQPRHSIRKTAADLGLSYGSVQTILKKDLHLFPYRLCTVQGLQHSDYNMREESCFRFLDKLPKDTKRIIFSDEATFSTDGNVNTWNCRIWSVQRPTAFCTEKFQNAAKVTIWAAMTEDKLFGPYFFPDTVTGQSYRDILEMFFFPEYRNSEWPTGRPYFMQDGAPSHTALATRSFLKEEFVSLLIGKFLPIHWPGRSPDLNPLVPELFLAGFCT